MIRVILVVGLKIVYKFLFDDSFYDAAVAHSDDVKAAGTLGQASSEHIVAGNFGGCFCIGALDS